MCLPSYLRLIIDIPTRLQGSDMFVQLATSMSQRKATTVLHAVSRRWELANIHEQRGRFCIGSSPVNFHRLVYLVILKFNSWGNISIIDTLNLLKNEGPNAADRDFPLAYVGRCWFIKALASPLWSCYSFQWPNYFICHVTRHKIEYF